MKSLLKNIIKNFIIEYSKSDFKEAILKRILEKDIKKIFLILFTTSLCLFLLLTSLCVMTYSISLKINGINNWNSFLLSGALLFLFSLFISILNIHFINKFFNQYKMIVVEANNIKKLDFLEPVIQELKYERDKMNKKSLPFWE